MTLLVTIFLVLINIFNTIQTNSPKAEGLTAIEAWVIACIIFVFGALGEYTVILLKIKLKKLTPRRKRKGVNSTGVQTNTTVSANSAGGGGGANQAQTTTTAAVRPNHASLSMPVRRDNYGHTDLVFLIVFPLLFGAFNLFYWVSLYWWRWDDSMAGLKW